MMKIKSEIRLENLFLLIEEAGSQVNLARIVNVKQTYINALATKRIETNTGKQKNIGERFARKLEAAMNKPYGWLDQDHSIDAGISDYVELIHYDIRSSAGAGKIAPDNLPTLNKLQVLESWAFEHFGKNATNKIRIINNSGDSMSPTISDGDVLFIDITQKQFSSDGIYIIDWHGRLLTKRLKAMMDGRLAIISDNKAIYETEYVTEKDIDNLNICGAVKKWWTIRG